MFSKPMHLHARQDKSYWVSHSERVSAHNQLPRVCQQCRTLCAIAITFHLVLKSTNYYVQVMQTNKGTTIRIQYSIRMRLTGHWALLSVSSNIVSQSPLRQIHAKPVQRDAIWLEWNGTSFQAWELIRTLRHKWLSFIGIKCSIWGNLKARVVALCRGHSLSVANLAFLMVITYNTSRLLRRQSRLDRRGTIEKKYGRTTNRWTRQVSNTSRSNSSLWLSHWQRKSMTVR